MSGSNEQLIGSIDEGTSSTRFIVFSSETRLPLASHQINTTNICLNEGWIEQDPVDILCKIKETIRVTCEKLKSINISPERIVTVGITNQRETTLVWDKNTGNPLYNAIIWMDVRTKEIVDTFLSKEIPNCKTIDEKKRNIAYISKYFGHLQSKCGLTMNPYFSVFKIIWLIENVPEVTKAIEEKRCMFGTMDSWIIWNLTGGINGGIYVTDVTNASRTMLMNIHTLQWDQSLIEYFKLPKGIFLPEIRSCSEIYGYICDGPLDGKTISGCVGDQQAALIGHMCFEAGQIKSTFGTGCFLLYNTGHKAVISTHGLLTTVAYKLGKNAKAVYALEGSVAVAGAALKWLKDNLGIVEDYDRLSSMMDSVPDTNGVHFVPAFSGLYAPYWKSDARGTIVGLTLDTTDAHLVRATFEGVCFQTKDVLESMQWDTKQPITTLKVDGGMTVGNGFLQILADLCGTPVVRPQMVETTAMGAALAAGMAIGIWDMHNIKSVSDTFVSSISKQEQLLKYTDWKKAVSRSIGWHNDEDDGDAEEF